MPINVFDATGAQVPSGDPASIPDQQVANAAGVLVNPATQETLASVDTKLPTLSLDGSGNLRVSTAAASAPIGTADAATSGNITALNGTVQLTITGLSSAAVVVSGTWVATMVAEVSADAGNTWVGVPMFQPSSTTGVPTLLSSFSANGTYRLVGLGGTSHIRLRASAFTSGTATVSLRAAAAAPVMAFTMSRLQDGTGTNIAKVDSSGNLSVITPPPTPPVGTTPVSQIAQGSVAAATDTTYVIPNGNTLTVQNFRGGALVDFKAGSGAKIELFYDPLGTGVGMTLIDVVYSAGDTINLGQNYTAVGNGTRRMLMRRTPFTGTVVEIYGKWDGFLV